MITVLTMRARRLIDPLNTHEYVEVEATYSLKEEEQRTGIIADPATAQQALEQHITRALDDAVTRLEKR